MHHYLLQFNGKAGMRTLDLMVAGSAFERMRGLLARAAPHRQQGMLLPACRLIHTVGMAYPIDVIYLDKGGRVMKVTAALKPRRIDGHWRAHSVLEMAAGEAQRCGIAPGMVLALDALDLR